MADIEFEADEFGDVAFPDFGQPSGEVDVVVCDSFTGYRRVAMSRMSEYEAFKAAAVAAGHSV